MTGIRRSAICVETAWGHRRYRRGRGIGNLRCAALGGFSRAGGSGDDITKVSGVSEPVRRGERVLPNLRVRAAWMVGSTRNAGAGWRGGVVGVGDGASPSHEVTEASEPREFQRITGRAGKSSFARGGARVLIRLAAGAASRMPPHRRSAAPQRIRARGPRWRQQSECRAGRYCCCPACWSA